MNKTNFQQGDKVELNRRWKEAEAQIRCKPNGFSMWQYMEETEIILG